jgi:hypothetical protein
MNPGSRVHDRHTSMGLLPGWEEQLNCAPGPERTGLSASPGQSGRRPATERRPRNNRLPTDLIPFPGRNVQSRRGGGSRIRERKPVSRRGTIGGDGYRKFRRGTFRSVLSAIGVRLPPSRLQASQTTSSGGSARKPAPAPHPPDDAVGTAWASTRHRLWARSMHNRRGIWYQDVRREGRPVSRRPGGGTGGREHGARGVERLRLPGEEWRHL